MNPIDKDPIRIRQSSNGWIRVCFATAIGVLGSAVTVSAQSWPAYGIDQPSSAIGEDPRSNSNGIPNTIRMGNQLFPAGWSKQQDGGGSDSQSNREIGFEDRFEGSGEERPLSDRRGEPGEADEIETDRDSFTPSTKTVRAGRGMVEASYSFLDNRAGPETHSFPELLFRYGLYERTELRIGWNYEIGGVNSILTGNPIGEPPIESEEGARLLYGIKRLLSEQEGWRPESSIILQGSTPTHGESDLTFFNVTPVAGWRLPNEMTWDFATRFATSGERDDRFQKWSPSTVIKIPVGERAKAHVEYFGVFTDGRAEETVQHFISPGVHYLLNQDLEIGWRAGWGLNDQSPDFFINFGIARQF
jgi:hypothetical protein